MDCDKIDKACEGGSPVDAYAELHRLGGLMSARESGRAVAIRVRLPHNETNRQSPSI